jgi:hypothetical protein
MDNIEAEDAITPGANLQSKGVLHMPGFHCYLILKQATGKLRKTTNQDRIFILPFAPFRVGKDHRSWL